MARITFAPDGKRFHIIKKGSATKLWDYFFSIDILLQLKINPYARFKLYGKRRLLAELPPRNETGK